MGVSLDENLGTRPVIFVIWGGLLLAAGGVLDLLFRSWMYRIGQKGGGVARWGIQPVATTKSVRSTAGWRGPCTSCGLRWRAESRCRLLGSFSISVQVRRTAD